MPPDRLITISFAACSVHIAERFVLSVFRSDGSHVLLDIDRGNNPTYRGYAADCGYGDAWERYARHHDLVHHWLGQQREGWSPTLWEVAHGRDWPDAELEEAWVNGLQRLWADAQAGRPWQQREIERAEAALGPGWRDQMAVLSRTLDAIP